MKPFNLEAALAGAKVVTRDGLEVKIAGYNEEAEQTSQLAGWLNGSITSWQKNGQYWNDMRSDYDLFMAPTERKEWVVRWDTNICVTCKTRQSAEYMAENHKDIGIATIHEIIVIE